MTKSLNDLAKKLETVDALIDFAVTKFKDSGIYFGHGTDNPWDEAVYLILHTLDLPLDSDRSVLDKKVTPSQREKILKLIEARIKKRIPAPYLTNEAWFAGLSFYVDERVLIPRSPIAELVENSFVPWIDSEKVSRILDIGTGSGCIAISCAYAFPVAKIDAIDVSEDALAVAAINCKRHKVESQVNLIKSDLFEKLEGRKYDLIISNPPYVGDQELQELPEEYLHEPTKLALHAGKIGDEIVDEIIKSGANYLNPNGVLIAEVGNSAPLIIEKYPNFPFVWLEFERGDAEVFLITREQLLGHKKDL